MEKLNRIAQSSPPQERRHRRFSLQYPVLLKVHSADLMVEFEAVSRNISICGLLLESASMIPQHTPVSFIVTVKANELGHPIQFAGEGRVVRVATPYMWTWITMRDNIANRRVVFSPPALVDPGGCSPP
jgi:hypothetical protein